MRKRFKLVSAVYYPLGKIICHIFNYSFCAFVDQLKILRSVGSLNLSYSFIYILGGIVDGATTGYARTKVGQMIDSGFGLELWAESGTKILNKRKKASEY